MNKKWYLLVIVIGLLTLHLIPLIPPAVETPNTKIADNISIDTANALYDAGDFSEAIKYYYSLAIKHDAYAQYKTGFMYLHGDGIKRDLCESTYWFDQSARQGYAFAQFELSRSYHIGYGIRKDDKLAYFWARSAISKLEDLANNDILDTIRSHYRDTQLLLKKSKLLDETMKEYDSWLNTNHNPVNIIRLRKLSVFDQPIRKLYGTQPCDNFL